MCCGSKEKKVATTIIHLAVVTGNKLPTFWGIMQD